jgi:carbon starvation protein CstA
MALAIVAAFVYHRPHIPELWEGLNNHAYTSTNPIFPMMFISIACGAISGFHATQSPLMARCMTNEKQGRPIFYGAMISEGVVALIWAAAASYFFGPDSPVQTAGLSGPAMVGLIANTWFTPVICVITILGVISASVTSGDTALRSARLIVADFLHIEQKSISKRLIIAVPLFLVTGVLLVFSLTHKEGFEIIWRYFGWANQLLSVFTLWSITFYLAIENKKKYPYSYLLTLIPALFMTMVCSTFIIMATNTGLQISAKWSYFMAGLVTLFCLMAFISWLRRAPNSSSLKE